MVPANGGDENMAFLELFLRFGWLGTFRELSSTRPLLQRCVRLLTNE